MGYLYSVLGWGIVALGVVHMTATFRLFGSLTGAAIWFFTGGIAMALTGSLNLLNRAYGAEAPGLRWFCVATNVTMTAVAFVSGRVGHARLGQLVFIGGWFAATAAVSVLRAPVHVGRPRTV